MSSIHTERRLQRLPHAQPFPSSVAETDSARRTVVSLSLVGLWVGLLAGLAEVVVLLARGRFSLVVTPDLHRLNRHFLWMTPVSAAAMLLVLGAMVGLARAVAPRLVTPARAFLLLTFVGFVSPLLRIPQLHFHSGSLLALGLASLATRRATRRNVGGVAAVSVPVAVLALLSLFVADWLTVIEKEPRALASIPQASPGRPNVLVVVLDTVRADSLSLHGYHRPTSPNLSRLAERGVVFDQARSTTSWTLPAHASLFTGRWPHETKTGLGHRLGDAHPVLSEILAAKGYATAGIVANTYCCNAAMGLGRGFAHYTDFPENEQVAPRELLRASVLGRWLDTKLVSHLTGVEALPYPRSAAEINRDALAWIDARPVDRPFFLFLNYLDAHSPYRLPADAPRPYADDARRKRALSTVHNYGSRDLSRLSPEERAVFDATATAMRDAYDQSLAYLDQQLGRLVDELNRRGLLENTLLVVTSDHGELLGEHRLFGHVNGLYRPLVHVPLVVVPPRKSAAPLGQRVSNLVSTRDVPATVLDLAGVSPPSPIPGRSLARFWNGGESNPADDAVLAELDLSPLAPMPGSWMTALRGPMKSVVTQGHSYILNGDGTEELYDVQGDPDEARNLMAEPGHVEVLRHARQALRDLVRSETPCQASDGSPPPSSKP